MFLQLSSLWGNKIPSLSDGEGIGAQDDALGRGDLEQGQARGNCISGVFGLVEIMFNAHIRLILTGFATIFQTLYLLSSCHILK